MGNRFRQLDDFRQDGDQLGEGFGFRANLREESDQGIEAPILVMDEQGIEGVGQLEERCSNIGEVMENAGGIGRLGSDEQESFDGRMLALRIEAERIDQ